ncbi:hypothetical protein EZS27_037138 [termite gut metagenome]|uniref:BIG2 domain-containing protein n=1 Tax=termite gut metagenome TaxID=433724 RepID=A0A5J4PSD8_9ZZZZ
MKNKKSGLLTYLSKKIDTSCFLLIMVFFVLAVLPIACGENGEKNEEEPIVPVTGISVTPDVVSLLPGGTQEITVAINPENASQKVTWTSSDPKIATVENGIIKAVKEGEYKEATATITVTSVEDTAQWATIAVTVEVAMLET